MKIWEREITSENSQAREYLDYIHDYYVPPTNILHKQAWEEGHYYILPLPICVDVPIYTNKYIALSWLILCCCWQENAIPATVQNI